MRLKVMFAASHNAEDTSQRILSNPSRAQQLPEVCPADLLHGMVSCAVLQSQTAFSVKTLQQIYMLTERAVAGRKFVTTILMSTRVTARGCVQLFLIGSGACTYLRLQSKAIGSRRR